MLVALQITTMESLVRDVIYVPQYANSRIANVGVNATVCTYYLLLKLR